VIAFPVKLKFNSGKAVPICFSHEDSFAIKFSEFQSCMLSFCETIRTLPAVPSTSITCPSLMTAVAVPVPTTAGKPVKSDHRAGAWAALQHCPILRTGEFSLSQRQAMKQRGFDAVLVIR
jgi:hypothetical protein